MLDIGCGDGLLLQRIAPFAQRIEGIDPDVEIIKRAQARLAALSNVELTTDDFLAMQVPPQAERYQTVISVATLHHMELRAALTKMRDVLAPSGKLLIVGLAADKSITDYLINGLFLLPIRFMDRLHGGMQDIGVRIVDPQESIREIRKAALEVLPGAVIRRRFYYRYTLTWTKPSE